ncbi:MAG: hypothetical protein H0X37_00535 [Herpetosiphonaceae bacterium]|nr:hypothetical protein [Herpetosiphonaceae bacterium]
MIKWKTGLIAGALAVVLAIPTRMPASAAGVLAPDYKIAPWATDNISGCPGGGDASPTCYYNVDSETTDGSFVYAGYQNNGAPDGSSGSSIVAKYAMTGGSPVTFLGPFPGKTDGLRINPADGTLWVLNNEDASPILRIVNPQTGAATMYALPVNPQFGGGYDDIAFTAHGTFLSASNPTPNPKGFNTHRLMASIQFLGGKAVLTPMLVGFLVVTNRATGTKTTVNITDPDSLSVDPASGDVVLDGQADSTLIFIHNAGTQTQQVSALRLKPTPTVNCGKPPIPPAVACPPIIDETTWTTSKTGYFLIGDHALPGAIYQLTKKAGFGSDEAYSTVSSDNPTLANTVGQLNTHTGFISPVASGFTSPKGLLFVPTNGK